MTAYALRGTLCGAQRGAMVDSTDRIGSGTSSIQPTDGRGVRSTATGGQATSRQPTPNGPRGMRMLSPDTPLDQLDRSAPRGSYLDILV